MLKYVVCFLLLDGSGVYPAAICRLQNRFVTRPPVAGRKKSVFKIKAKKNRISIKVRYYFRLKLSMILFKKQNHFNSYFYRKINENCNS